ncbi:MAG: carbamate kinase [bacterium]
MDLDLLKYNRFLVALGGNAIIRKGGTGTFTEQVENAYKSILSIAYLIEVGKKVIITHGNGPQVGNCLIRVEKSIDEIPPIPLFVCDAQTQGEMGFLISQALINRLREIGLSVPITTVVTQVIVDRNDPLMTRPSKPVGPYYTKEEAESLTKERGWVIKKMSEGGHRRLVPSPRPEDIIEADVIKILIEQDVVVIACGGGGIPVFRNGNRYEGIDAVIDKDRASALLAFLVSTEVFVILTSVDSVYLDFGKITERRLDVIRVDVIERYLNDGQFPAGSMGPKIEASIDFLRKGGKVVLITSPEAFIDALNGKKGTVIYP